ncbi:hypothetical protein C41B8_18281 [Salinisphaera hydrothermalis C41B8]|uniref:Uncharacterized protein n=1 Tax=Salinisphaera hydrothermalis (strain C41B8) TaxID=1304275 RepID=A0A084IGD7_SALHC|nr:hypothetical protein C41B8_18281 [Salinisphaera hydrothermalis C41B8]
MRFVSILMGLFLVFRKFQRRRRQVQRHGPISDDVSKKDAARAKALALITSAAATARENLMHRKPLNAERR